ncbi:trypsin-like serine peptidase [Caldimonas brevitalea]|uniref:Trypsin-like serine protease n=1 Tax=Caldimonas brevitalea TaxID=413882 RepID=A0A0G3BD06_9BURK|nr:serine protease [Caldimonas brevitalea]AKJ27232.1 trypsin-like serine protease [Caldimonas brevitalea]
MSKRGTVEPVLLTSARVTTFQGQEMISGASGFFFRRDERLYLVTSRHVLWDPPTGHHPDRLELELHTNTFNLTLTTTFSILLYRQGEAIWRQASDSEGEVDVAVIELDQHALPERCALRAFTPAHLQAALSEIEIGTPLLVVGFPLGFHDTLHHLPVARLACVASSFGVRFQGQGYFLTDARTHRGTSGAPVLMRDTSGDLGQEPVPWKLLGIHSSRMDMGNRDLVQDEALGLNCAWYADVLMALTDV